MDFIQPEARFDLLLSSALKHTGARMGARGEARASGRAGRARTRGRELRVGAGRGSRRPSSLPGPATQLQALITARLPPLDAAFRRRAPPRRAEGAVGGAEPLRDAGRVGSAPPGAPC